MSYTPGPWTTTPGRFWICNVGNNRTDPGVWSQFPVTDGEPFPFGDKKADARLIAAAPEMLEFIKDWLRNALDPHHTAAMIEKAQAVVAKAENADE